MKRSVRHRVHVVMLWYYQRSVDGRANHWPYIYNHTKPADTPFLDYDYCTNHY
jgi:hypothetical protein